ncbi:NAD(+) diphosphatase [Catenovulum adriaticum]|uniref:NAD(+) diphosphatase n=1 Tax=Catenovulum adriaticum TaxID=2984846 RepID=A0ABY7AL12_9ALTE|nr:NAD(+) diphosphatase [Catenovulum sp. TS8]WAJ69962.1 NAD(+) diphosphatase [Catenovulum sp. TS8]
MQVNQLVHFAREHQAHWLIVRNDEVYIMTQPLCIPLQSADELFNAINANKSVYLGEHKRSPVYFINASQAAIKPEISGRFIGLKQLINDCDFALFGFAAKAVQFQHFLETHRYCGRCGQKMKHVGWEMAVHCKRCHHRCYPRLSPCVIMAVLKGNSILLAQGKKSQSGVHSVLAGFVEPGETLEQAVAREVKEETNINVKNPRYFASQAWPFPHQLMVGFIAEYESGKIVIDEKEILHADWYNLADLPETPGRYSIAGQLIEYAENQIKS